MRHTDPTHPFFDTQYAPLNKGMSEVFNPKHFVKASINPIGELKKGVAPPGMGGTKWSPEVINRYIKAGYGGPAYKYSTDWKYGAGKKPEEKKSTLLGGGS